jgi:C-terminal processing protease CtpA/Prc
MSRCLLTPFALVVLLSPAFAQQPSALSKSLDAAERTAVIDGVLDKISKNYVFPDVAKKMEEAIRGRAANKEYDTITSGVEFATKLTEHLREVCKDKHLSVRFSPDPIPQSSASGPSAEDRKRFERFAVSKNYGFQKVEHLPGGVGYLDLRGFMDVGLIGETAAAAMTFLSTADAVIFDMRQNNGGDPAAVILLCSYLFDQPTHLNDIYTRGTDTTRQYWSLPTVAGKKLVDKDVYVLTAKRTFSGAEEFAYNLQSQKRGTIVGETTGGGAHPTRGFRVTDHFMVGVPFARSINPVTKTNWEGTGVKPDVPVPADQALHTAHLMALKKAAEKNKDDKPLAAELKRETEKVQKELDAMKTKAAAK